MVLWMMDQIPFSAMRALGVFTSLIITQFVISVVYLFAGSYFYVL